MFVDIDPARILATTLMRQHGLVGWRFTFDHARRRFGCCKYARRTISLSRPLTLLNSEAEVRDTILHEIAHALTPGAGHGAKWKAMCAEVGARPTRCYRESEIVAPRRTPAPMQIGCPACGWWQDRRRRTGRKLVCRRCRAAVVFRLLNAAAPV